MKQQLKKLVERALVGLTVCLLLAALPAFGFGFDDAETGFVLMGIAFLLGLLVIWTDAKEILPSFIQSQAIAASIVWFLIVAGIAYGGRWHVLKNMREDVSAHFGFKAELESQDNLNSTVVTISNGGSYDVKYSFICHIKLLVTSNNSTVRESNFRDHVRGGILEHGTGAQYDDCLSDVRLPLQALKCADIQVKVQYALTEYPQVQEIEAHGFVTRKIGNRFEWYDRAANQSASDCEQFVSRPSHEDILRKQQDAMRRSNQEILRSHSTNTAKALSASLSEQIFGLAEDREKQKPTEPPGIEIVSPQMDEYRKKFSVWLKDNADSYSKFVPSEDDVFAEAQREGFDISQLKNTCRFPWDVAGTDVIQNCAMSMGILAQKLK